MLKICPLQVFLLQSCIQGSAPLHIVPSLDYSSSDLVFLWLPRETKFLKSYFWCWAPRDILTDFNCSFRMRQSYEIPTIFWGKWHLSGTERPRQNHQQGKGKGNLLLCIPIITWLVCQKMLWATLHMRTCQAATSTDVLLYHEYLGSKTKLQVAIVKNSVRIRFYWFTFQRMDQNKTSIVLFESSTLLPLCRSRGNYQPEKCSGHLTLSPSLTTL